MGDSPHAGHAVLHPPARRLAVALGAGLVIACGGRPEPGGALARDSAGVSIVENVAPVDGALPRYRLDSVPLIDIGGGSDPHAEFGDGVRAIGWPGRSIVVAVQHELRWFDRRGQWIRTVGREGSGPGEFRQIDLVSRFGDSVLVYDFGLRRASVFDSAGRYGRGTTMVDADTLGETFPVGVLADGRMLIATYHSPRGNGLRRDRITLRVGTRTGAVEATIGTFPYVEQLVEVITGGVSMGRVAFGRMTYWGVRDSSILVATNERFGFDWYSLDGKLNQSVRRTWTPVPVTAEDVNAQIDDWLSGFPAGMEERKAKARAVWIAAPRPEAKPPYGPVLVSAAGEVWVQEYGEPGQRNRPARYSVFDRAGRWLCRVAMPAGVDPLAVEGDEILATWRDRDDATHVRVYRLTQTRR